MGFQLDAKSKCEEIEASLLPFAKRGSDVQITILVQNQPHIQALQFGLQALEVRQRYF